MRPKPRVGRYVLKLQQVPLFVAPIQHLYYHDDWARFSEQSESPCSKYFLRRLVCLLIETGEYPSRANVARVAEGRLD